MGGPHENEARGIGARGQETEAAEAEAECFSCTKKTNIKAGEVVDENGAIVGILCDDCWDNIGEGIPL